MADNTFFDGCWEDNDDLFGDDMGHYSHFPFLAGDQAMASYPHSGYNATNNTPAAEAMAMDTASRSGNRHEYRY